MESIETAIEDKGIREFMNGLNKLANEDITFSELVEELDVDYGEFMEFCREVNTLGLNQYQMERSILIAPPINIKELQQDIDERIEDLETDCIPYDDIYTLIEDEYMNTSYTDDIGLIMDVFCESEIDDDGNLFVTGTIL